MARGDRQVGDTAANAPILPPVEQVKPGIWSLPIPIPGNPLHYVVVYALEGDAGLVLLDAGWDAPESFAALQRGLSIIGGGFEDVAGVVVTHIHPDHYGLAGRIREQSGAWIGLHPADAAMIYDRYEDPRPLLERQEAWLRGAGSPEHEIVDMRDGSLEVLTYVRVARPDVLIEGGDRPDVPGWELVAVHTPGHTPGHLCFHELRSETLFTGDHVLPRITPNVAFHAQSSVNPLGDFLRSLEALRGFGDVVAYPAHEWRFDGLQQRIDELIGHHAERLDAIEQVVRGGAETVWDVASQMSWSRGWDRVHGFMRRAALGETWAHMILLEEQGRIDQVTPDDSIPVRWRATRE